MLLYVEHKSQVNMAPLHAIGGVGGLAFENSSFTSFSLLKQVELFDTNHTMSVKIKYVSENEYY